MEYSGRSGFIQSGFSGSTARWMSEKRFPDRSCVSFFSLKKQTNKAFRILLIKHCVLCWTAHPVMEPSAPSNWRSTRQPPLSELYPRESSCRARFFYFFFKPHPLLHPPPQAKPPQLFRIHTSTCSCTSTPTWASARPPCGGPSPGTHPCAPPPPSPHPRHGRGMLRTIRPLQKAQTVGRPPCACARAHTHTRMQSSRGEGAWCTTLPTL